MPMVVVAPTHPDPTPEAEWTAVRSRRRSSRDRYITSGVPTLVYGNGSSFPVWEITTGRGRVFYVERLQYPGFRPVGLTHRMRMGESLRPVSVCVNPSSSSRAVGTIQSASDFNIPDSWYEPVEVEA